MKKTPPQLATEYSCDVHKILTWIKSGELRAVNVATTLNGRPRYLIDEADIQAFENRRAVGGPIQQAPRRRRAKQPDIIQFF